MQEARNDPVVFEAGVHRHVRDGVEVTLVVPHDVRLSQILPALAGAAAGKGAGDGRDAA